MSLSRPSPESFGYSPGSESFHASPPQEGKNSSSPISFSEAFSDASSFDRLRDSLPEQHRTHLDELRKSIFAFCDEFQIPREALKSKETFGVFLASPKIPPARMAEAVSLFARLEHLVTNKEPIPLKETLPEYLKEIEHLYNLGEQYTFQVKLLEQVGILKEGVITGIDGNKYPIPTLEQIATRLFEREKDLSTKRDQGFTKLLLVPFGMSLDTLRETFKQFLLSYKQTHSDFDLDVNDPLFTWKDGYPGADTSDPPKIFYHPTSFDPHNHQGQTKLDILKAQADNPEGSFPGWIVHLLQAPKDNLPGFCGIPRQGQGKTQGEVFPRPDLEANKTSIEYLSIFQEAQDDYDPTSPYFQESGLTPEDWILAFITHLQETGQPLDNYQNSTESMTYLTGAFFPSIDGSAFVPCVCWLHGDRRADLDGRGPRNRGGGIGARSSVIV